MDIGIAEVRKSKKKIEGAESTIAGAELSIGGAEGHPKGIQIDTHASTPSPLPGRVMENALPGRRLNGLVLNLFTKFV